MEVPLHLDVIGGVLAGVFFIAWLVRLESTCLNQGKQIDAQDKKLENIEAQHKLEIKEIKSEHSKELAAIRASTSDKDKVVWDKMDHLQTTMNTVLQSIGRLEGKMEVRNSK